MIRINLLPDEYRRKNRTPVKMMLAVVGVVIVNTLLLSWVAFLNFGVAAEIESERAVLQTEVDGLNPQIKYHKSLEAEKKLYAMREQTLGDVTKNRISWTRKVDELVDVVNRGGEGKNHMVWFDDLNVQQQFDQRTNAYGSLKAAGHSGSANFAQVANFLEDVEAAPFAEDFAKPSAPEGTQTEEDKDLVPSVVWTFPLQVNLKSPDERKSASPQTQKNDAAAKARADKAAKRAKAATTTPAEKEGDQ